MTTTTEGTTENTTETKTREVPRLKARYRAEVLPALRQEFGHSNVMQVPGLTKIVVNMGVGDAAVTCPRSPARSRRSPAHASPSPSSSCARACRSART